MWRQTYHMFTQNKIQNMQDKMQTKCYIISYSFMKLNILTIIKTTKYPVWHSDNRNYKPKLRTVDKCVLLDCLPVKTTLWAPIVEGCECTLSGLCCHFLHKRDTLVEKMMS